MNTTLAYLRGRRLWAVPGLTVYGTLGAQEIDLLTSEFIPSAQRLLFRTVVLGGVDQTVYYGTLVDAKGNFLPATLANPKVIVLPKSNAQVIVAGPESNVSFRLARTDAGADPAVVDLLIVELG
jgi:hypothetical protein